MGKEENTCFQMRFLLGKGVKDTEKYVKTVSDGRNKRKRLLCHDSNLCWKVELRPILEIRQNLISVSWM